MFPAHAGMIPTTTPNRSICARWWTGMLRWQARWGCALRLTVTNTLEEMLHEGLVFLPIWLPIGVLVWLYKHA